MYTDNTGIFYQHEDITEFEKVINKESVNLYKFDNKMPIHFGEDKTKCMLFSKEKSGRRLTLSLTGTHCAGSSTDLPSNSNISKTVRVNIRV